MTDIWLPDVDIFNLAAKGRGYGPFRPGMFHGVIVHVNEAHGNTSMAQYAASDNVCPNLQIDQDGTKHQLLPLDWQPWCQTAGNQTYAAIECGGMSTDPYTAAQIKSIGEVLAAYRDHMGLKLVAVDQPGQYGIGTHRMGGLAWGGHSCPGDIRANQRNLLISAAGGVVPAPIPPKPPTLGAVLHRPWPSYMKPGNYFGLITGPAVSHGGYYANEKPDVKAIQQRLIQLGYVPGHSNVNDGWADGVYEQPTKDAVTRWQRAKYASTTSRYGEVWSDDWAHLFTY